MRETEGVIKFCLKHHNSCRLQPADVVEIEYYRQQCIGLGIIGQNTKRYMGYGFGNLSIRSSGDAFIISGTQTGGIKHLDQSGYAVVSACLPMQNTIQSEGEIEPSSEAMTHGQVYQLSPSTGAVIHGHCPEIWQCADQLAIPATSADVTYGTTEMAAEVVRLFAQTDVKQRQIFSMAGHEDGIVSFGVDLKEAFDIFSSALAKAKGLSAPH